MSNKCGRCGTAVFFAEELKANNQVWHKACFRCAHCSARLDKGNEQPKDKKIYCKQCHTNLFGVPGYGFGQGSGALHMDYGQAVSGKSHFDAANLPPGTKR